MPFRDPLASDQDRRDHAAEAANRARQRAEERVHVERESARFKAFTSEQRALHIAANAKALGINLLSTRAALNVDCDEHDADRGDWCWDAVARGVCGERMQRGYATIGGIQQDVPNKRIKPLHVGDVVRAEPSRRAARR